MTQLEHIPAVAIRGQRLGERERIEDVSAPESELGKLGLQIDVPVSVVFDDQGGRKVVVED